MNTENKDRVKGGNQDTSPESPGIKSTGELIVYCGGYPDIDLPLYLASQNWRDHPITIVTPSTHPDLLKFFRTINERRFEGKINVVCQEMYHAKRGKVRGPRWAVNLLRDIIGEKRSQKTFVDRHFKTSKGAEVYFGGKYWAGDKLYLLARLSEANTLVQVAPLNEPFPLDESLPRNAADIAQLAIWKFIYGRDIFMGVIPYQTFPAMSERFITRHVSRIIDEEQRRKMRRDLDENGFKEIFETGDFRIIYFHQDFVQEGLISDGDTFKRELAEVFAVIRKHFPENEVGRKYHPCYPGDKTAVTYGQAIEDFIPGELLFRDTVKAYISIVSDVLSNVEKGVAISIVDLLTFKDEATREGLKEKAMRLGRNRILFPKSLAEFEQILVAL